MGEGRRGWGEEEGKGRGKREREMGQEVRGRYGEGGRRESR